MGKFEVWALGTAGLVSIAAGCAPPSHLEAPQVERSGAGLSSDDKEAIARGRDQWLTATFGGERMFSLILPNPAVGGFRIGLDAMLLSPRESRFDDWGVVNDPDCEAGDATTYGLDKCPDPTATGVVGVRKVPNPFFNPGAPAAPENFPYLLGLSCAGCHAGLSAQNPPADANAPAWDNIHLTTGNQFQQFSEIFGAHLPEAHPRKQVFNSWAPGTVDTTAVQTDGINNPGTVTQFFEFDKRPYFDNHYFGEPITVHRAGQGGEDDVGCELAALRVYFNIGMCFQQCTLPALQSEVPIDMDSCALICPELTAAEAQVGELCAFINDSGSTPKPDLRAAPGGKAFVDATAVQAGKRVFAAECASCHSNSKLQDSKDSYSTEALLSATGFNPVYGEGPGAIGTNKCRSLSTNWQAGHIWQNFSSDEHRARGVGNYRVIPLMGAWATAPFLHNNRVGLYNHDPSVAGRVAAFEDAFDKLLNPQRRDFGASVQVTSVNITLDNGLPIPQGTPVGAFANVDPDTGVNLCDEYVENGGHYFGAQLSEADKYALREYVKTL